MEGDKYQKPNGLSCRPLGVNLTEYLEVFVGECIIELPKGLILPDDFVMIHEHTDHYSFQTTKSIEPAKFCLKAEKFFKTQKLLTMTEMHERVR